MADLIPYTTEQLLDLFKTEYFNQTNNPLLIGSDEFAFSSVASYVLRIFEQAMKRGADAISINTATGAALDNIAASFGITRPDATKANIAVALENTTNEDIVCDIGQIIAETDQGVNFTNTVPVIVLRASAEEYTGVLLYCSEAGSQYNGIRPSSVILPQGTALYVEPSASHGATDSLKEYTPENDEAFRAYLLEGIKALSVGTAPYYEYEAKKGFGDALVDVYCLRDGDDGFEPGKVKIRTLFRRLIAPVYRWAVNNAIRDRLSSDTVKCVTDYVEVREAFSDSLYLYNCVIYYETRFKALNGDGITLAQAHFEKVFDSYHNDLVTHFNKPYIESELEAMLCTPDENGVYATTFKSGTDYYKPPVGTQFNIGVQWNNITVHWI